MDCSVAQFLETHGLQDFKDRFQGLGVKELNHITYLDEDDLMEIGMNKVQARITLRAADPDSPPEGIPILECVSSQRKRASSSWWIGQGNRPRRLVFVRHGESEANVDRVITRTVPDHDLHLTAKGREQALDAGQRLRSILGDETVRFTVSPYVRTRETLNGILRAWGDVNCIVREDVRLREMEFGNFDSPDMDALRAEKKQFGAFYYRFPNGESPADCFDRASLFWESMYRSWQDNEHDNHVIVCHGMMILVALFRFLRIPVCEFDEFESLKNCEMVVLERPEGDPKFMCAFTWAGGEERRPGGLRKKDRPASRVAVWNGDPHAPLLTSSPATAYPP